MGMVCSSVGAATKLSKLLRARYVASLRSRLLRVRLVALSCSLYLTFDDLFIARRALFVKYFFTEKEIILVYVNLTARALYVTASLLTQRGNSLAAFLRKRGGEARFLAFCAPHAHEELGSIGSVR